MMLGLDDAADAEVLKDPSNKRGTSSVAVGDRLKSSSSYTARQKRRLALIFASSCGMIGAQTRLLTHRKITPDGETHDDVPDKRTDIRKQRPSGMSLSSVQVAKGTKSNGALIQV